MEPNVTPPQAHEAGTSWLASMPSKIIWRAALVGAASALPLPGVNDLVSTALYRGLIFHVTGEHHVEIDDNAVEVLLAEAPRQRGLGALSAVSGMLSLIGRRTRLRRLASGLAILQAIEVGVRAFQLATSLDHYCTKHHTGAAIRDEQARRIRDTSVAASSAATHDLIGVGAEKLFSETLGLIQGAAGWVWARVTRNPSPPTIPSGKELLSHAQSVLANVSVGKYLGLVRERFDRRFAEAVRANT
jgi:hypothetical protein